MPSKFDLSLFIDAEVEGVLNLFSTISGNRPAAAIEQLPVASNIQYLSFRVSLRLPLLTS